MLASGGVVLMPTDTLPGLHCRADNSEAVARIVESKQRSTGKPFVLLADSHDMALNQTSGLMPQAVEYLQTCWPGPFSLILPAAVTVPDGVTSGLETVAIRVPVLDQLRQIIKLAGGPLVSTSVNRSGEQPIVDLDEAIARFSDVVDGIWMFDSQPGISNGNQLDSIDGRPSGLIDLTVWPPQILREGTVTPPDWRQIL